MLTSGVVSSLDHDDNPDDEGETSSLAASKITGSKERFGTSHSIPWTKGGIRRKTSIRNWLDTHQQYMGVHDWRKDNKEHIGQETDFRAGQKYARHRIRKSNGGS